MCTWPAPRTRCAMASEKRGRCRGDEAWRHGQKGQTWLLTVVTFQKHCKHHMLCHMVDLQKGPKDIDYIYIYIYVYIYICIHMYVYVIPPKKSLPKSGSLGVRQNIFFGQPKCLQGCAMTDS